MSLLAEVKVPAYDQVKVWEIDPTPKTRPREPREPREARPRPRLERRWSPRTETPRISFGWWTKEYSVWARLTMVTLLSTSILFWPYAKSCGLGLSFYMMASLMIVVGGLWVVVCTWIERMPRTHAMAMVVALWGVSLLMVEILPRVGYARTSQPVTWLCGP